MNSTSQTETHRTDGGDEPLASHEVRLSARQWAVVAVVVAAIVGVVPVLSDRAEHFAPGDDWRVPYPLSEDYRLYGRAARRAGEEAKTLVIGDSVIWGEYVSPDRTLTHYLNARLGEGRFANLGLDGTHPIALAGLIDHFGRTISRQRVLLHCNPLWMASPVRDLQVAGAGSFNHPRLIPQFFPRIPAYRATIEERLKVVVQRTLPYDGWDRHIRLAYFGGMDIPRWTVERPGDNPFAAVTFDLPLPLDRPRRKPVSWRAGGLGRADLPWVKLADSLQWRGFQRCVEVLLARGNKLFVCLGPLNEHMLTERSRLRYVALRRAMAGWLRDRAVPYYAPPALASDLYADASHPLAAGYAALAEMLAENAAFGKFCADLPGGRAGSSRPGDSSRPVRPAAGK